MESRMVRPFADSNIELIVSYIRENLPQYNIIAKASQDPNWSVKFAKNDVEINVSGDIGFSIEIFIDKTKYDLWQYDRSVNNAMKTTDENILYQLEVLKNFLKETAM